MKKYKDFEKRDIGCSDIATLILVGCKKEEGVVTEKLYFGEDGSYKSYVIYGEAEIGSHYEKRATFNNWLKIYDDDGLTYKVKGDKIDIYRAGDLGCIINIINDEYTTYSVIEQTLYKTTYGRWVTSNDDGSKDFDTFEEALAYYYEISYEKDRYGITDTDEIHFTELFVGDEVVKSTYEEAVEYAKHIDEEAEAEEFAESLHKEAQEWLDNTYYVSQRADATTEEKSYYEGAIEACEMLGYKIEIKNDKHKLYKI